LLWRNIFLVRRDLFLVTSDIFLVSKAIFPSPGISASFYSWWREYKQAIFGYILTARNIITPFHALFLVLGIHLVSPPP
jgi:hypothetical protein